MRAAIISAVVSATTTAVLLLGFSAWAPQPAPVAVAREAPLPTPAPTATAALVMAFPTNTPPPTRDYDQELRDLRCKVSRLDARVFKLETKLPAGPPEC